jgi:hypothetical protein
METLRGAASKAGELPTRLANPAAHHQEIAYLVRLCSPTPTHQFAPHEMFS